MLEKFGIKNATFSFFHLTFIIIFVTDIKQFYRLITPKQTISTNIL